MKEIRILPLLFALVLAAPTSCKKEEPQKKEEEKKEIVEPIVITDHNFTLSATLQSMEGSSSDAWVKGERASVVNLTTGKILGSSLTASDAGSKVTFTGTVHGNISASDNLALFFPAFDFNAECDFGTRKISIASQSSGAPMKAAWGTFKVSEVTGTYSGIEVKCSQVLSSIKFNATSLPSGTISKLTTIDDVITAANVTLKSGSGFDFKADETATGQIELSGPYTSEGGACSFTAAMIPYTGQTVSAILLSVSGYGDCLSRFNAVEPSENKSYDVAIDKFERIGAAGKNELGAYFMEEGGSISSFNAYTDVTVSGTENGLSDFAIVTPAKGYYWQMTGIPENVKEGDTFTASISNYGYIKMPESVEAAVKYIKEDNDLRKIWIVAGDYSFIVCANK